MSNGFIVAAINVNLYFDITYIKLSCIYYYNNPFTPKIHVLFSKLHSSVIISFEKSIKSGEKRCVSPNRQ